MSGKLASSCVSACSYGEVVLIPQWEGSLEESASCFDIYIFNVCVQKTQHCKLGTDLALDKGLYVGFGSNDCSTGRQSFCVFHLNG